MERAGSNLSAFSCFYDKEVLGKLQSMTDEGFVEVVLESVE
jgi:hypothetical protein